MPVKAWTKEQEDILREMWPTRSRKEIAEKLKKSESVVKARAAKLKLRKAHGYKMISAAIPSWKQDFLREHYTEFTNHGLAKKLKISESAVQSWRKKFGLNKENEGCFPKGHVPFNKGQVMDEETREKVKHTWFPKGHEPKNTLHDYAITERKDKNGLHYLWIRIEKGKWVMLQIWFWEKENGPLPKGKILRCKDGNTLNPLPENWEAITRKEHMLRNTLHRYRKEDPELYKAIHARIALARTITLQTKKLNKK